MRRPRLMKIMLHYFPCFTLFPGVQARNVPTFSDRDVFEKNTIKVDGRHATHTNLFSFRARIRDATELKKGMRGLIVSVKYL